MSNAILVVEDDTPTCMLWSRHLAHWGWQVHTANNVSDAEEAILKHRPLAVILDVMLADERSGWDLLAKMRSWVWTRHVPVVVVSAVDEPRRAFREGATAFLVKPCSPHTVVTRVAEELVLVDNDQMQ